MALTHALTTNNYGVAKLIVATSAANGTHTTLASAMADASAGDTIFLRNSVTENVTITPGVNIAAWQGSSANTPSIIGTLTMTGAGTSTISGIRLQTNGASLLTVSGSAASIINLDNCYLNCTNATGISYTSSSSSSQINVTNCQGNLGTTGIGLLSSSGAGIILFYGCNFTNSGASTTGDSASAGTISYKFTQISHPVTTSSTASLSLEYAKIATAATNTISLTVGGSASNAATICHFASGTAAAISIGSTLALGGGIVINSSNSTAVITGAGTLSHSSGISFIGTGTKISSGLTISSSGSIQGLVTTSAPGTSPAAGFLGERISSVVSAVALTTTVFANVTSISLTPGVWDVTTSGMFISSASVLSSAQLGISTTSATIAGTQGDQYAVYTSSAANIATLTMCVPAFRAVVTSTTTYYMVGQSVFGSGTCNAYGRLSAVRVG